MIIEAMIYLNLPYAMMVTLNPSRKDLSIGAAVF
jgi:hypothetical protein